MYYYRFRPYSELSLKELMYNEMYFSSTEECNDPYDSKTFYTFDGDIEKWVNLILFVLGQIKPKPTLTGEQLQALTEHYCRKCPLTFNDLIFKDLLNDFKTQNEDDVTLKNILTSLLPNLIKRYQPSSRYFVSFSKDHSEPLMWSHYANKHKGFSLIFKTINGKIKQFEFQKKHQIRRKTPHSFAEEMSWAIPSEFPMIDIDYSKEVKSTDAFLHLPVAVLGKEREMLEKQSDKIREEHERHFRQKGISWRYEKESRLILSPPLPWLFGEHIEFTTQEKLLHYDPSHLVGIIYGSRLADEEKNRIQEIIKEKRDWGNFYLERKRIEFNFMEFDAKLSQNERIIKIEPIAINNYNRILKDDKEFNRLYKEWQEGWGFERNGNSSKKTKIE